MTFTAKFHSYFNSRNYDTVKFFRVIINGRCDNPVFSNFCKILGFMLEKADFMVLLPLTLISAIFFSDCFWNVLCRLLLANVLVSLSNPRGTLTNQHIC